VARRGKSPMDAADARRFVLTTVNEEATNLLNVVDEIYRRYPPDEDLRFIRYLVRMVVLATMEMKNEGEV
jgi:hypothetical protein